MKLSGVRQAYYDSSAKASDIIRNLNFAGIAVVWIIKKGKDNGDVSFSPFLYWPLIIFVISLLFDSLQYIYKSLVFSFYARHKEKEFFDLKRPNPDEEDIPLPRWFNWPSLFFFWGKISVNQIGYILLIIFIAKQLSK